REDRSMGGRGSRVDSGSRARDSARQARPNLRAVFHGQGRWDRVGPADRQASGGSPSGSDRSAGDTGRRSDVRSLAPARPRDRSARRSAPSTDLGSQRSPRGETTMTARVLIVDDEANIRRMLGALLKSESFEVAEAPNGPSALLALDQAHPDVILLDLLMPP